MPLYEYQCRACDATFEERRPFSASAETAACPVCGSDHTRKALGAVRFISNGGSTAAGSIPLDVGRGGSCGCGGGGCGCGH